MTAGLERLAALRDRAQHARTEGDGQGLSSILREVLAIDADAASERRSLGRALTSLASEMVEGGEPADVEALFNKALKMFEGAPDVRLGDLLVAWNNLAALYSKHGAGDRCNQVNAMMGGIAAQYEGPVDSDAGMVFMQLGEMFHEHENFPAMLVMFRQVQRFMLGDAAVPDETRALWFQRYARALAQAGAVDSIESEIDRARTVVESWPTAPASGAACYTILASCCEKRGDWMGAAERLEQVMSSPALPAGELTETLSLAGRAWFKAGRFEDASRCYTRAVRRRAGLEAAAS
jgi:tetratricopeptide (TPR) repeat protein